MARTIGVPGAAASALRRGERGQLHIPIAGVTMLAVMMLIAVHGLLMGQAAETFDSLVRHDLEEELIFRGEEIARGIEAFQKDNVGRLPTKMEELCPKEKDAKRYIRRLWLDPMTGKDFRLITPAQVGKRRAENEAKRAQEEGEDEDTQGGFGSGERVRSRERDERPQGPSVSRIRLGMPGQESRQQLTEERFQGVASNEHEKGFREYQGTVWYDEWEFVAVSLNPVGLREQRPPGALPPGATPPGGLPPIGGQPPGPGGTPFTPPPRPSFPQRR